MHYIINIVFYALLALLIVIVFYNLLYKGIIEDKERQKHFTIYRFIGDDGGYIVAREATEIDLKLLKILSTDDDNFKLDFKHYNEVKSYSSA